MCNSYDFIRCVSKDKHVAILNCRTSDSGVPSMWNGCTYTCGRYSLRICFVIVFCNVSCSKSYVQNHPPHSMITSVIISCSVRSAWGLHEYAERAKFSLLRELLPGPEEVSTECSIFALFLCVVLHRSPAPTSP